MRLQLLWLLILCSYTYAANILAVLPSVWKSHYLFGRRLLQHLVAQPHNHSVTLISPHAVSEDNGQLLPNIREIRIEGLQGNWMDMGMSFAAEDMYAQNVMERFTRLVYAGTTNVDLLLSDEQVRKLIGSGERFDLLIVDLFLSDALLGLAYYYGIPTIAISPTVANSWLNNMFGNPQRSTLDPSNFLPFSERMDIGARLDNTLMSLFERLTYNFFYMISQQSVYAKHFEQLPSTAGSWPHCRDLAKNLSLALLNSHAALHYPRAYLPNMLEIGGAHLLTTEELHLPNHLRSFIESAPNGVIYMSLGADVRTDELPHEKLVILFDVIAHLKEFRFLLKWESEEFLFDVPEHVMISRWWPQQAILAHSKVKLFISSCGLLSVWESIAGRTPILAIPILPEQVVMANRLQQHGVGLNIHYEFEYDSLLQGVHQLTTNTSYYMESLEILRSRILPADNPSIVSKAVQYIELVLTTDGLDYLKSHSLTLNYWRAEGLDVLLIITLGFCSILAVPFIAISCILRRSYYTQTVQEQQKLQQKQQQYRSSLKVVGRMHSYGDGVCVANANRNARTEPLRRTRSALSLSGQSSCSSNYSSSTTNSTASTASTTPLELTPPAPTTPQLFIDSDQQASTGSAAASTTGAVTATATVAGTSSQDKETRNWFL